MVIHFVPRDLPKELEGCAERMWFMRYLVETGVVSEWVNDPQKRIRLIATGGTDDSADLVRGGQRN
jgi:hypothetical protein